MMPRLASRFLLFISIAMLSLTTHSQQTDTITVYFAYNRSVLLPGAIQTIDEYFLSIKNKFRVQAVNLAGYCDNTGPAVYNDSLSLARVTAVKVYLCNKWINPAAIRGENGFGENFPLNNNATAAARAANRRVAVILQKNEIDSIPPVVKPLVADTAQPAPPMQKDSLFQKIMDTATRVGSTLVLQHIIFYGGRHIPMPESLPVMNELLQAMRTNRRLKIEINGYICCEQEDRDGTDEGTGRRDLSVQRAKFIYDFLVDGGIKKHRMKYAGFGASHKLYPAEKTLLERTMNRRVEITITDK